MLLIGAPTGWKLLRAGFRVAVSKAFAAETNCFKLIHIHKPRLSLTPVAERHDAANASTGGPDNRTGTSGNPHTDLTRPSDNTLANCGRSLHRPLDGRCLRLSGQWHSRQ